MSFGNKKRKLGKNYGLYTRARTSITLAIVYPTQNPTQPNLIYAFLRNNPIYWVTVEIYVRMKYVQVCSKDVPSQLSFPSLKIHLQLYEVINRQYNSQYEFKYWRNN